MWFEPASGFCIWRDQRASEEWGLGITELGAFFDELEIPYLVRIEAIKMGKQRKTGFTAVLAWHNLETLTKWVPSFQTQVDNARAEIDADPTDLL
ncbi:hypothetical protein [Paeniglutamicibacter sp.]|uniref:hypothetical protein n=1 Tax=Paeniglutamicibacter sp. TaxID=1934391 RepID=UPI003989C5FB